MPIRRRHPLLVLALCSIGSAAINAGAFYGITRLMESEPLPEQEEITYLELKPIEQPPPLPPEPEDDKELDRDPSEPLPPKPKKRPKPKPEKEPERQPEKDKPKPEPQPQPEPEPEKPKEQPDFVLEQLKMVEQPDELDEQDAPDDVEYLSNINRDVAEQTRARVTNLQEDSIETKASQVEQSEQRDVGTANDDVIAQDEQKESKLDRQAPNVRPDEVNQRPNQQDPQTKNLLAMRELEYREHKMAQLENEALASDAVDGALSADQKEQSSIAAQDQQARIDRTDPRYRFKLSHNDLDAVFGKTIDAKKRMEAKKQSKRKGVWSDAQAAWQSPLENMVPEVQVGNQTALRSRKHPFARYIAQMHRKIHEAWAWGFLEQLDTRGRKHPLNDFELWTRVEIVLDSSGRIEKVITVRYSGNTTFDAAAREIVHATGPYPNPPDSILSGNGKVYIHWAFHRNNNACGTFGAQPFILDNAGQGERPDPGIKVRPGRGGAGRLARRPPSGRGGGGGGKHTHKHGPPAPVGPVGPQPPPTGSDAVPPGAVAIGPGLPPRGSGKPGAGPRPLPPGSAPPTGGEGQGNGGSARDPDHKVIVLDPPAPKPEELAPSPEVLAEDPLARKAAREWLSLLHKGDAKKLTARSSLPFYSGDRIIARNRDDLSGILTAMSEEAKDAGKPTPAKIHTASGLRKVFGSVPAGVSEGSSRVYGLSKIGGEYIIVILEKKFSRWRVVGVTR